MAKIRTDAVCSGCGAVAKITIEMSPEHVQATNNGEFDGFFIKGCPCCGATMKLDNFEEDLAYAIKE